MSDGSSIEWCDASWNPLRATAPLGKWFCQTISPGCDRCYASTFNRRLGGQLYPPESKDATQVAIDNVANGSLYLDEKALLLPLKWRKPRRIFLGSMTDLFGTWVPADWIGRIISIMGQTPQHTYIVLTKRPTRMRDMLSTLAHNVNVAHLPKFWPLPNVWVGVTIESDQYAWRADRLRQTPAAVRWISAEPLLSGLPSLDLTGIDWLVTGGESGPKARPMHPSWPRDLRDRAQTAGTAYFFKQHGEWATRFDVEAFEQVPANSIGPERCLWVRPDGKSVARLGDGEMRAGDELAHRIGSHRTGRVLDGRTWDEYPVTTNGGAS